MKHSHVEGLGHPQNHSISTQSSRFFFRYLRRWQIGILLALVTLTQMTGLYYDQALLQNRMENGAVFGDAVPYFTAAWLVGTHRSQLIYAGADTGADPQTKQAPEGGPFRQAAQQIGMPANVMFYLYPPLLADMLVPLSRFWPQAAFQVWFLINGCFLLASVSVLCRILGFPLMSKAGFLVMVASATTVPTVVSFIEGQVTLILLFCWISALYTYQKGMLWLSSFLLALGTGLKLTPVIAMAVFVLWREWRWVAYYLGNLAALTAALLWVNGPGVMLTFFRKVMPAMTAGFPGVDNRSIQSCVQVFGQLWGHMTLNATPAQIAAHLWMHISQQDTGHFHNLAIPSWAYPAGRIVSFGVVLLFFGIQAYQNPWKKSMDRKLEFLAATMVLSIIAAPVSWLHAYVMAIPIIALTWKRLLSAPMKTSTFLFVTLATMELINPQLVTTSYPSLRLICMSLTPFAALYLAVRIMHVPDAQSDDMHSREHEPAKEMAIA